VTEDGLRSVQIEIRVAGVIFQGDFGATIAVNVPNREVVRMPLADLLDESQIRARLLLADFSG
jgi:hypothetical protein